jgi:hypothetical protein
MPTFAPSIVQHRKAPGSPVTRRYDRNEVIDAIPDKAAPARRWDLRIAARESNDKGWWCCHAIDRPDANPSASFSERSGNDCEGRDGVMLSLFDLAAELGIYPTWLDALNALGAEFVGPSHTHRHACPGSLARTRPGKQLLRSQDLGQGNSIPWQFNAIPSSTAADN